eukprot:2978240-Prymnesium_polylepis.1
MFVPQELDVFPNPVLTQIDDDKGDHQADHREYEHGDSHLDCRRTLTACLLIQCKDAKEEHKELSEGGDLLENIVEAVFEGVCLHVEGKNYSNARNRDERLRQRLLLQHIEVGDEHKRKLSRHFDALPIPILGLKAQVDKTKGHEESPVLEAMTWQHHKKDEHVHGWHAEHVKEERYPREYCKRPVLTLIAPHLRARGDVRELATGVILALQHVERRVDARVIVEVEEEEERRNICRKQRISREITPRAPTDLEQPARDW